jgi:hypothetical protein
MEKMANFQVNPVSLRLIFVGTNVSQSREECHYGLPRRKAILNPNPR